MSPDPAPRSASIPRTDPALAGNGSSPATRHGRPHEADGRQGGADRFGAHIALARDAARRQQAQAAGRETPPDASGRANASGHPADRSPASDADAAGSPAERAPSAGSAADRSPVPAGASLRTPIPARVPGAVPASGRAIKPGPANQSASDAGIDSAIKLAPTSTARPPVESVTDSPVDRAADAPAATDSDTVADAPADTASDTAADNTADHTCGPSPDRTADSTPGGASAVVSTCTSALQTRPAADAWAAPADAAPDGAPTGNPALAPAVPATDGAVAPGSTRRTAIATSERSGTSGRRVTVATAAAASGGAPAGTSGEAEQAAASANDSAALTGKATGSHDGSGTPRVAAGEFAARLAQAGAGTGHAAAPAATLAAGGPGAPGMYATVQAAGGNVHGLTLATPVLQAGFTGQFAGEVASLALAGIERAEITVQPRELGPVRIELSLSGETARIAFSAVHPDTRHAIEQSLPVLKDLLGTHGLLLSDASVSDGRGGNGAGDPSPWARNQGGAGGQGPHAARHGSETFSGAAGARARRGLLDLYA